MQNERLLARARQLLTIEVGPSSNDTWLAEHSERVMRHAQFIAAAPEIAPRRPDAAAVVAAALFHDAGWIVEYRQGRWERWQLQTRPTSDIQRELGAALLTEQAAHLIGAQSLRLAAEAIRQASRRDTRLLEAQILAEAEALDEFGPLHVLRQFRTYQGEGRPAQQLVDSWQRQREYRYWDLRLAESFRFEFTRGLARARLEEIERFIQALARALHADDLRTLVGAEAEPLSPGAVPAG